MNLKKKLEKSGWDFTIIILCIISSKDGYFQQGKIPTAINETVFNYKLCSSLWKDNKRNKNYWDTDFPQYKCTEECNKLQFKEKKSRTLQRQKIKKWDRKVWLRCMNSFIPGIGNNCMIWIPEAAGIKTQENPQQTEESSSSHN